MIFKTKYKRGIILRKKTLKEIDSQKNLKPVNQYNFQKR